VTDLLDHLKAALTDRYTIERELGHGGMAIVYLAHDRKLDRLVALKVLRPELAASLGADRFLREIEIAAKLTHPNILGLHDCGEADGQLYYTMPFVEGESLRDRLNREKQLPIGDALQIAREVAGALGHAHSLGIVHRDIKPENILFTAGHAVVSDFGIARAVSTAGKAKLTETGLAVGTPAYMSPEQAAGDPALDARSDVYSLACVLYELLGGAPPFTGATPQAVLAAQIADPVPSLRSLRPTVPAGVERALEQALAKDAGERYAKAEEFVEQLTRASTAEAVAAEARRERVRRRWRAVLAVASTVLVAALGWWGVRAINAATGHAIMRRLAVLPLASFTNDTSQEYFVQGVHDALISDLQEAGLTVLGRTSVLQYQRTDKPPHQIPRELGVDGLIEGSVRRAGDSVEIAVRLIDGRTEVARWQHTYPGELRSIFALYHGVTRAIAEQIQSSLSPAAAARLATTRTVDPQVYDDYLRGDLLLQRWTQDYDAALEYFQRALRRDSTYAPAWAGIAQVWLQRAMMWSVAPLEAFPQARVALQKALELDSNSADVQSVTGTLRMCEWDWAGAERAYRRAIEINPNHGGARSFYATFLMSLLRFEEAHRQIEQAMEIDPLNPFYRSMYGILFQTERRFGDAEREFRTTLQTVPDYAIASSSLWAVLSATGRYDEALAMLRQAHAGDQSAQDALTQGLAEGGYRGALRRLAMYWGALNLGSPWGVADLYILAGEKDSAFAWLERGYQAYDPFMVNLIGGDFDSVRDDPRFRDLCRRMNLPTCAQ
jgi:serine/threonine-protein kinase